jgi:GTP-binding protein EngB required for normal cell division
MNREATIALSLISHTNAGKTTLARTLLGRDVGTVSDAQHVTEEASSYPLIETAEGDVLLLWDTPGFGDSARLAHRLAQQGNPIGWFLSQVWDRIRDRAFFLSQQAVRNVRDDTDVVLYLVNASETPQDAGYLSAELDVLQWVGKPVIVLMNQTGAPRARDEEEADEARWRNAVVGRHIVRDVATLDAFTRCWVQEVALFDLVCDALPASRREACARLGQAWRARRLKQFDDAMEAVASPIAAAACDREPLTVVGAAGMLRELGRRLGIAQDGVDTARTRAANILAARLDTAVRASTDRLIAIHGLGGRAGAEVLARMATGFALDAPVSEAKAAMMGGVASGAISGLAADLATGGLTFGAGMLAGALLGALGGAGIARGMNLARGKSGAVLRWDDAFLSGLVASSLLRYLAVAHYGRGRGDWVEAEYPAFWPPLVMEAVESRNTVLSALWASPTAAGDVERIAGELRLVISDTARDVLERLYPGALAAFV